MQSGRRASGASGSTSRGRAAERLIPWFLAPVAFAAVAVVTVVAAPFLVIAVVRDRLRAAALKRRFEDAHGRHGRNVLLVYSDSPNWKAYIDENLLPRIAPRAVVLNWSERAKWTRDDPWEAELLRHWGGRREFNPLALVFERSGRVRTFRFFEAFHEHKHGKSAALEQLERELIEAVHGFRVAQASPAFSDWDALHALLRASYAFMEGRIDPPSSIRRMDAHALQTKAREEVLILAHDGDRLVGCAFARLRDDCVYVGKVAVDAAMRRRGVAAKLIAEAEAIARAHGRPFVEIEARVELTENHATFAALGFVKVGESAHAGFDRPTSITMRKAVATAASPATR
jgi:ribosomal protein S18 acetylase RimI-like enzyme